MPTAQFDKTASATFTIVCSQKDDDKWTVDSKNDCDLEFKINSRFGCPNGMYGTGSSSYFGLIIKMLLFFAAYIGLGIAYNMKMQGKEGIEAFPHVEFWANMPGLAKDGVLFTV